MDKEIIIPMDDKLHPIGTLMYEDCTIPNMSTDWKPQRKIWRVYAHRECQDFLNAPVKLVCAIEFVRWEVLDE